MLSLVFLSPLFLVILIAVIIRYLVIRRKFRSEGFVVLGFFAIFAFLLPLIVGAWIPDFLGYKNVTGEVTTSSGHRITVVQHWNHVDFYTTEVIVYYPSGGERGYILDGDDNKHWSTPITLDQTRRVAIITLDNNRTKQVSW